MRNEQIIEQKKSIRKSIATFKKSLTKEALLEASVAALSQLEACDLFGQAKRILIYYALPDEVQTEWFIEKWHKEKVFLLPVVEDDHLLIRAYRSGQLHAGSFGILEPDGDNILNMENIDLVIVPGVAFDTNGNRLGRGKGYYDRLLPQIKAPKIGIGFSWQIIQNVPTEETDQPLNGIITDKHNILFL